MRAGKAKVTIGPPVRIPSKKPAGPFTGIKLEWMFRLAVPLRVRPGLNVREHWSTRAKRVKVERTETRYAFYLAGLPEVLPFDRVSVLLTRKGGRRWDSDNNVSGLKAVRDEVSNWLGLDDGDPRVTWSYSQEPGGEYEVVVEVRTGVG